MLSLFFRTANVAFTNVKRVPHGSIPTDLSFLCLYSHQNKDMPKKRVKGGDEKANAKTHSMVAAAEDECPVHQNADNTITIKIVAKPGAKHNSVTDVSSDGVGVQIAAPPVDGEANTELLKYLASVLDLRKSEISLDKGSKSRSKSVRIIGSLSKEEVMRRLTSEISDKCS